MSRKQKKSGRSGSSEGADTLAVALSPREREVIYWSARGRTEEQTAELLGLSQHTVHGYIRQVLEKLGAKNVAEGTYLAGKMKLID